MDKDKYLNYQNPKAGKMPMLLGILGAVGGIGTIGAGLVGLVNKVSAGSESFYTENAKELAVTGTVMMFGGIALYGLGRLQHWYSNKTYQ